MPVEHYAEAFGTVKELGEFDGDSATHRRMSGVAVDIEEHGEVHATFKGVEGEVELRLGTTLIDYDTETFKVWDGDFYQSFSVDEYVNHYRPMDVRHQ